MVEQIPPFIIDESEQIESLFLHVCEHNDDCVVGGLLHFSLDLGPVCLGGPIHSKTWIKLGTSNITRESHLPAVRGVGDLSSTIRFCEVYSVFITDALGLLHDYGLRLCCVGITRCLLNDLAGRITQGIILAG